MAVEDYRKLKKLVDKNQADNKKALSLLKKETTKTQIRLQTLVKMFSDDISQIAQIQSKQPPLYAQWVRGADQIIELQKELKAAASSKDGDKTKEVGKRIISLHSATEAISQKIQKNLDDGNKVIEVAMPNFKALHKLAK